MREAIALILCCYCMVILWSYALNDPINSPASFLAQGEAERAVKISAPRVGIVHRSVKEYHFIGGMDSHIPKAFLTRVCRKDISVYAIDIINFAVCGIGKFPEYIAVMGGGIANVLDRADYLMSIAPSAPAARKAFVRSIHWNNS